MIRLTLIHHDGSESSVNLSPDARLCDLSMAFAVDAVHIEDVSPEVFQKE